MNGAIRLETRLFGRTAGILKGAQICPVKRPVGRYSGSPGKEVDEIY